METTQLLLFYPCRNYYFDTRHKKIFSDMIFPDFSLTAKTSPIFPVFQYFQYKCEFCPQKTLQIATIDEFCFWTTLPRTITDNTSYEILHDNQVSKVTDLRSILRMLS